MAEPVIAGYDDFALIGTGGFSRVYRAEQERLKRQVAIKVLNVGLNTEAERRSFLREAETLGRVSTHPNIVSVYDTEFTAEGNPCIVMEHYPGGSLGDLISEIGRLSVHATLEVGVAIASALAASHRAGVVHCDLKPHNILISEFGQPVLGDFGISTLADERTRTGDGVAFTLSYAAPEIVEGASPSIETDVYSLAATLYTALAGESPFGFVTDDNKKPSTSERARRIVLEDPAPLTDYEVPAEVDAVIRRAMAKEPENRPPTAAAFAVELHEVGHRLGYGTSLPRTSERGALPVLDTSLLNLNDAEFTQTGAVPTHARTPDHPEVVLGTGRAEPALAAADPRPAAVVQAGASVAAPATAFHAPVVERDSSPGEPPTRRGVGVAVAAVLVAGLVIGGISFVVARQDSASSVAAPTSQPEPTVELTAAPTVQPEPTAQPDPTVEPASAPTAPATAEATPQPTPRPTDVPTTVPASANDASTTATGNPQIGVRQTSETCTVIGCVLEIMVTGFPPGEEVLVDVFEQGTEDGTEPVWFVPLSADESGSATTSQPFLYTEGTFEFKAFTNEGYPTDSLAETVISLISEE